MMAGGREPRDSGAGHRVCALSQAVEVEDEDEDEDCRVGLAGVDASGVVENVPDLRLRWRWSSGRCWMSPGCGFVG